MTLKMTQQQFQRVQALINPLCCNYDDEYCIALDDGETQFYQTTRNCMRK